MDTLRMELVEDGAVRAIVQVPRHCYANAAVSFPGPARAIVQVPHTSPAAAAAVPDGRYSDPVRLFRLTALTVAVPRTSPAAAAAGAVQGRAATATAAVEP